MTDKANQYGEAISNPEGFEVLSERLTEVEGALADLANFFGEV